MEEKKENEKKNEGLGCVITLAIVFAIIIALIAVSSLSDAIKSSNEAKHRLSLVQEGKTISSGTIMNEIAEILKNRQEDNLKEYLADNFKYIDNDRCESKNIDGFWKDIKYFVTDYDIEKRENSIKDEETYRIYWNTNNLVKERADRLYCSQKIIVILKEVVKNDMITYEIEEIMLTDN